MSRPDALVEDGPGEDVSGEDAALREFQGDATDFLDRPADELCGAGGIDLWAAKDPSNNNSEATLAKAAAEGVANPIEVKPATSRGCRLPMRLSTRSSQ